MPACVADHPGDAACLHTAVLYDYIANEPKMAPAGLGLPMLVYQNRQDLVYTSNFGMTALSSTALPTDDQVKVRAAWRGLLDAQMGLVPGSPNEGHIPFLFAVDDPTFIYPGAGSAMSRTEPNIHAPGAYFSAKTGVAGSTSLEQLTEQFWAQIGNPGWRSAGEIIDLACNLETRPGHPEDRTCP